MKRLALGIAAILWCVLCAVAEAAGQTALLSWTPATAFTDSTSFTAAQLAEAEVIVCWTPVAGTGAVGGCQPSLAAATTLTVHINCGQVEFTAQTYLPQEKAESAATAPILYDTGLQCVAGVTGAKVSQ